MFSIFQVETDPWVFYIITDVLRLEAKMAAALVAALLDAPHGNRERWGLVS